MYSAAAGLTALIAVAFLLAPQGETSSTTAAPSTPAATRAVAMTAPPAERAIRTGAGEATVAEAGLTEQIDRLLAGHTAQNLFDAYRLISDCAAFNRDHDRFIFDTSRLSHDSPLPLRGMTDAEKRHDAVLCEGMSERTRLSRIDYLAAAAKGGIGGAAIMMAQEGPFGDPSALLSRPDDPLVQEWKRTAKAQLEQLAEAGDLMVLDYVWTHEANGDALFDKNPALAYRYMVAQGLIWQDIDRSSGLAKLFAPDGDLVRNIASLNDEQRAAELAAATRIAALAAERRRAARKS